jgi:hypothetical protein
MPKAFGLSPRKRRASLPPPPQSGRTLDEFQRYPWDIVETLIFRFAMCKRITSAGFTPPANRTLGTEHRTVAIAEFIASVALALSTLIAATVVSVGIARADVVSSVIDNEGGVFAIALLLGLLFIGMGGVTIISLPHQSRHRKTHS